MQGSVHPLRTGIEAGLSAVGDIFNAIASRAGTDVKTLSAGLGNYRAGQTGLLRMTWDNGDRTVLVNPNLRGVTLGWNLQSTAQDELFAAIEGTALHTRVILDRMAGHGVHIKRVINADGIPHSDDTAESRVCQRPEASGAGASGEVSLGPRFSLLWSAGTFKTIEEAQDRICPTHRAFLPDNSAQRTYEELYPLYSKLYFTLGQRGRDGLGDILPSLIAVAASSINRSTA